MGRAEPGVGRRRRVDGDGGTDDDGRHRDDDQKQDEQLLAPLAPEEAPGPADHGPAGRDAAGGRLGGRPGGRPLEDADAHRFGTSARNASGLSTGSVWSTMRPSRRKITRSAHEASCASWVTTTAAMPAVAGRKDQAHDGLGVGGVERAGGLVGQEQLASPDDGAGDGDPLALATRQLVGVVRRPVLQPEVLERLERRRLGLAGRDAVELEGQGHVLHRAQPGQQVVVLEDVADGLAAQPRLAVA